MQFCSWLLLLAYAADAATSVTQNAVRSLTGGGNVAEHNSEEAAQSLRDNLKAKETEASQAQLEIKRLATEEKQAAEATSALQSQLEQKKRDAAKNLADSQKAFEVMMASKQKEVSTMEEQARKLAQAVHTEEDKIVASLAVREASSKKSAEDDLASIKKKLNSTEPVWKKMKVKQEEFDKPLAERRANLEAEISEANKTLQSHVAQMDAALKNMRKDSAEMLETDGAELLKLTKQKKELESNKAAMKKTIKDLDSKINTLHVKTAKSSIMAEQQLAAFQKYFLGEQEERSTASDTGSKDNEQVLEFQKRFHETHARKVHKVEALNHELLKLQEAEHAAVLQQTANLRGHA